MKIYDENKLKNDLSANFNRPYQQCTISVMDTIADPDITFDENGICNYYYKYLDAKKEFVFSGKQGEEKLHLIIEKIKKEGINKKYDCITGVSGGVDSTYLALQAKKFGLRPLIVHFDNGWNSEIAVKNVQNIINILGFDLYTLVVDWEEFKDVQLSFLKANVVDIEAITDSAIYATLLKLASKYKIKYILSGNNVTTEYVLPQSWIFKDYKNIIDIHNKFGTIKLKTLPLISRNKLRRLNKWNGIEVIELLNYLDYNKDKVIETIKNQLNWKDYGGKHFESVFTRFYQSYILPTKFNIDKRKAHLSNLIFSCQITKEQALENLKEPIIDKNVLQEDMQFVIKKFGISQEQFNNIMLEKPRNHREFNYTRPFFDEYKYLRIFKPLWNWIKNKKN